jgi:hypothetical protein
MRESPRNVYRPKSTARERKLLASQRALQASMSVVWMKVATFLATPFEA